MADTRQIRARRGPVAYLLRTLVIVYLAVLVIWPLYEVGKQTFAPSKAGAEGGFSAFLDRLSDPSVPESEHHSMLERYSELQDRFRLADGYSIDLRIATEIGRAHV